MSNKPEYPGAHLQTKVSIDELIIQTPIFLQGFISQTL